MLLPRFWVSLLGASLLALPVMAAPLIIAHRGASHDAPENTVPAFRLGFEQGADACELDVYLAADGEAIVIHDETLRRTTGMAGKVRDVTVAGSRLLDAGLWKGEQWRGTPIPTLVEALATVPPGKKMVIEIKDSAQVLPAVVKAVQASGLRPEQVILFAFKFETIVAAHQLLPQSPAFWLVSYEKDKKTGLLPELPALIAKATAAKLTGLSLQGKFPLDAPAVASIHAAGLQLYVWTVNDADLARQLAAAGADALVTDRPGWLRAQLQP